MLIQSLTYQILKLFISLQSHFPPPVSTATSMPSAAVGPLTDLTPHTTQMGLAGSNFQAALPLYQPGGNMGSWGASPPPPAVNGGGLAMPMYWQRYYAPAIIASAFSRAVSASFHAATNAVS
ncbi:hypothetical protein F3Y22_tig00110384pilonHSYRG00706 [Hibiscus syriacus]|uniref:Uncharacterized protein n=1 Tax=Hibiscus syriacus TaxID=106335 RepID=A0A6A3AWJ8_HIBSY|nr:hypothetical protein F3Y22_tig00110384pilonHSYRG00706 [Hibiscus syriacus]